MKHDVDVKNLMREMSARFKSIDVLLYLSLALRASGDGVVSLADTAECFEQARRCCDTDDELKASIQRLFDSRAILTTKAPLLLETDLFDRYRSTKRQRQRSSLDLMPDELEAFERIWRNWPKRSDGKLSRGDKLPAMHNFCAILRSGRVSLEDLEEAASLYHEHPNVKSGFVREVRTFFNPQEGIWYESVEIARARRHSDVGL